MKKKKFPCANKFHPNEERERGSHKKNIKEIVHKIKG